MRRKIRGFELLEHLLRYFRQCENRESHQKASGQARSALREYADLDRERI